MRLKNRALIWIICLLSLHSCYSFKGVSIPPNVKTFYVENFNVLTTNAPVGVELDFTEKLRQKMREQARLKFSENEPHVSFKGAIVDYRVFTAAAKEGDVASLNRLELKVNVEYTDSFKDENSYTTTYVEYEDFDANLDVQTVQDGLIEIIFDDIIEKLFNDTFTDW